VLGVEVAGPGPTDRETEVPTVVYVQGSSRVVAKVWPSAPTPKHKSCRRVRMRAGRERRKRYPEAGPSWLPFVVAQVADGMHDMVKSTCGCPERQAGAWQHAQPSDKLKAIIRKRCRAETLQRRASARRSILALLAFSQS
jgi:hypothetical protein